MAVRRVLYLGEPLLREPAQPVAELTDEIAQLIEDMIATMMEAPGLGLAAPQVGESLRIVVVRIPTPKDEDEDGEEHQEEDDGEEEDEDEDADILVLINPEVVECSDEQIPHKEGCLSLPTLQGIVARPAEVTISGLDYQGEDVRVRASGLIARILLHEIDHLDGVLFVDQVEPDSLVWLVPDEEAEGGSREEPTTVEEVEQRFERLRERRAAQQAGQKL
jgi:peptide deformylase